jgi:hypothetical protein
MKSEFGNESESESAKEGRDGTERGNETIQMTGAGAEGRGLKEDRRS